MNQVNITELKSGFWGYKKNVVCDYIAHINEEYSEKLTEIEKKYNRQISELQENIAELESENEALKKECENVSPVSTEPQEGTENNEN